MFCHLLIRSYTCKTKPRPDYISVLDACFIFNFQLKLVIFTRVNEKNRYESSGKLYKKKFSLLEQSSIFMAEVRGTNTVAIQSRLFPIETPAIGSHTICKGWRKLIGVVNRPFINFCTWHLDLYLAVQKSTLINILQNNEVLRSVFMWL